MKTSEQTNEIAAALSGFQADLPPIPRNRTVKVATKKGGSYEFAYATLDAIHLAIREPLKKHGLSVTHAPSKTPELGLVLETRLLHSSGQWISCVLPVIASQAEGAQALGSALTYMRRYSLTALLGIAADEDDDGNAADGNALLASSSPPPPKHAKPTQTPVRGEPAPVDPWKKKVIALESADRFIAFVDWVSTYDEVTRNQDDFAAVLGHVTDEANARLSAGRLSKAEHELITQHVQVICKRYDEAKKQ